MGAAFLFYMGLWEIFLFTHKVLHGVGCMRKQRQVGEEMSKTFDNLQETQEMLKNHYKHIKVDADRIFYTDISDIHLGHKGFDTKTFENLIDIIKDIPNFYVFLGGDTINHANKGK